MRIVTTTPTGNVGSRVVRLLAQAGVRPVVLTRDPARLPADLSGLVEPVAVDQTDRSGVVRATVGADRVFWVNPPAPPGGDPLAGHAACAAAVAAAVRENGIGGVVFQSSGGAELRHGAGEIDGLGATEEALDATGAPVVHLRCGYFMTNLLPAAEEIADGVLSTPWALDHPLPWVAPRDIGEVAVARLLGPLGPGRSVQAVHGPEDLTFDRVARILGEVLGRAVTARHVPGPAFRAALGALGMNAAEVDAVAGMSAGLGAGFRPEQVRDAVSTTPTTLRSWAVEHLRR
ncbi:NmrA family NAD(P)-binding protein [Pseudonocardia sp. HH130630-07]|uniref:NmrA family NAD(P)-binding protein n=1 Tax=Pseudonocardia sp. HH130630-07 TaxID=1690815 RepID=UPI000814E189|nr:NAD(P)H-binding protein [Pseudonocardia sp. HH130630-07]ANY09109.1 NmrA family transcriptional regulator [Pseudonocardia sp. HH130630-07]